MSTVTTPPDPKPRQVPPGDPTSLLPKKLARSRPLFDPEIVGRAAAGIVREAESGHAAEEPGDVRRRSRRGAHHGVPAPRRFRRRARHRLPLQIALWLWFTVLFANFAEAMAEARGKAQADSAAQDQDRMRSRSGLTQRPEDRSRCPASQLRAGDVVLCEAGDLIPGDGEVIEGIATVDESVITGESAPVIRESGGDRSAVTGGTRCCRTRSGSGSRRIPARPSWTA